MQTLRQSLMGCAAKTHYEIKEAKKMAAGEKICNLSNMFLCVPERNKLKYIFRNSNSIRSSGDARFIVIYFPLENLLRKSTFMRVYNHSELALTRIDWLRENLWKIMTRIFRANA